MVAPKSAHLAQLDRLEYIAGIPNIKLGIVPTEAGTVLIEYSSFAIYDDRLVVQAIASTEIESADKQEVQLHSSVFGQLERIASYDDNAIQLVRSAVQYFR